MSPSNHNHHVFLSTEPQAEGKPHYVHELPHEDEARLGGLFKSLDVDGNGRIDIHDLSVALQNFGVAQEYAQVPPRRNPPFLSIVRVFYKIYFSKLSFLADYSPRARNRLLQRFLGSPLSL